MLQLNVNDDRSVIDLWTKIHEAKAAFSKKKQLFTFEQHLQGKKGKDGCWRSMRLESRPRVEVKLGHEEHRRSLIRCHIITINNHRFLIEKESGEIYIPQNINPLKRNKINDTEDLKRVWEFS